MSIGKNIAAFRKAKGLTQTELGEMMGVSNQAVSKWEAEMTMPDVMLLPEIAKVLDVTIEELYNGKSETSSQLYSVEAQDQEPSSHTTESDEKRVLCITVDGDTPVKVRMPVEAARFFMSQGENEAEAKAWDAMLSQEGVLVDVETGAAVASHLKIEVVKYEADHL